MAVDADALENVGNVHARAERRRWAMLLSGLAGVGELSHLKVSQRGAGANRSVDVAVGGCFIKSTDPTHGLYPVYSTAVINVPLAAADATNPRTDVIAAFASDTEYGDLLDLEGVGVITGTPGPGAPVPSVPARRLELARVAVAAAPTGNTIVNANITDRRVPAGLSQQACELAFGGTSSFPNNPGTPKVVPFNVKGLDYSGSGTTGASAGYTAPATGMYRTNAYVEFQLNNARQFGTLMLFRNGTEYRRLDYRLVSGQVGTEVFTNDPIGLSGSAGPFPLTAGDVVTWRMQPVGGSGNAVNVVLAHAEIERVS